MGGKHILLGVTGSIAAYKAAALASLLTKNGNQVQVICTKNACQFITPLTFESLTGHRCITDTFDRNFEYQVEHISLAKWADVVLVAPASADIIAKASQGIADDMLTTTLLACDCPRLFAPAMNTKMYENPIVQDNLTRLVNYGCTVISPASGRLACGDTGAGKMPEPEVLAEYLSYALTAKDMKGLSVLVTAGPTQESLDPVRYLTNHSSGKMGYCIAREAASRGASVTLISGPCALTPPLGVDVIFVTTAAEMAETVRAHAQEQDIIIKAAAVADYRPSQVSDEKIKKKDDELSLSLERTEDILAGLGKNKKSGQFLCGFSMETENMLENARKKLEEKNLDLIVANNVKQNGAGFGTDTNIITLLSENETMALPLMGKEEVANRLITYILGHRK